MVTYPSSGHMARASLLVYCFSATSRLTNIWSEAFGRINTLKTCFPVHSSTGATMAGVGRSTESSASPIIATSWPTIARSRKVSRDVNR